MVNFDQIDLFYSLYLSSASSFWIQVCHAVSHLIDDEGDKLLEKIPDVVETIKANIAKFSKELNEEKTSVPLT